MQEITNWINSLPETFSARYSTPTNQWGTELGADPEIDLDPDEITDIKISESQLEFYRGYQYWILTACEFPHDQYGNKASYYSGTDLIEGWYELAYSDEGCIEYSFPDVGKDETKNMDFILWFSDNYPESYSCIGEKLRCNSTASEYQYHLTNIPVSGKKWKKIINQFLKWKK